MSFSLSNNNEFCNRKHEVHSITKTESLFCLGNFTSLGNFPLLQLFWFVFHNSCPCVQMMQAVGVDPGDFVKVTSVSLPRASFVKFQPQSVDFLDISNPKAVYVHFQYTERLYRLPSI